MGLVVVFGCAVFKAAQIEIGLGSTFSILKYKNLRLGCKVVAKTFFFNFSTKRKETKESKITKRDRMGLI